MRYRCPTAATALQLLMLLLFISSFPGCASSRPTLVVIVGGLGLNQLGDVSQAIKKQCPRADVVSAGFWDGYNADLAAIVKNNPHPHVVFIGHSFGCGASAAAAAQFRRVDLAVFIDPAWNDFRLPRSVARSLWYKRSEPDAEREARILDASAPRTIDGTHNSIPHSPELIAGVVDAINNLRDRTPLPDQTRPSPTLASR